MKSVRDELADALKDLRCDLRIHSLDCDCSAHRALSRHASSPDLEPALMELLRAAREHNRCCHGDIDTTDPDDPMPPRNAAKEVFGAWYKRDDARLRATLMDDALRACSYIAGRVVLPASRVAPYEPH